MRVRKICGFTVLQLCEAGYVFTFIAFLAAVAYISGWL